MGSAARLTASSLAAGLLVATTGAAALGSFGGEHRAASDAPPAVAAAIRSVSDTGRTPAGAEVPLQPDIFVTLIDDHAFIPDQRVLERLPNIRDLFIENGLRFTQMHNETPLCGPSRATLLSGRHSLGHGVVANDGNPLDQQRTLAVALDEAGYHTAMVGKYLNRWEGTRTPPGWDDMAMARGAYRSAFWRNGELTNYRPRYIDDANRVQVVEWTEHAPQDEPLFMLASVRAPHADQCVNDPDRICYTPRVMERDRGAEECADIPDFRPPSYSLEPGKGPPQPMPDWPDGWKLEGVCESLLVIDRMIGQVRTAQTQRERPAIFIFMSDNGMAWGQHGSPFKRVPWSTRMPFYIAGDGIEPGETDALIADIDIPATIAAIAGAEMPWAAGESFVPLLEGEQHERTEMLESMDGIFSGVRTPEWHYVRWQDGQQELYAYRDDEWHLDDLAASEPELVASFDARLDEMIEDARAS